MDPTLLAETLPRMGELIISEINSPLPLENTEYHGNIIGPVATITVIQHFLNPLSEPAELKYLFPLSHSAAIVDFELTVGERTIRAELLELEKAREEYENALRAGRRTGLLEERRRNLIAIQLGNVRPGESLNTRIQYQERLRFHAGGYELVIPMGITPRYHSPEHPEEGDGLDAPISGLEEPIGGLEIDLAIDSGVPTGDPVCSTHPIEFTRLDQNRFNLQLVGSQIPDHDFVLHYPVVRQQVSMAAWRTNGEDADYFLVTLIPPAWGDTTVPIAREYIFVLDRSGSMYGVPMRQAVNALRACLRTLNPKDQFRILLFNNQFEWYQDQSNPVTQESVDNADGYLSKVDGAGGTEIVPALVEALSVPIQPGRDRVVVFLTDGAVSAEDRAYMEVDRLLGRARLFTIGIGPSVNRAFLERLARMGRGRPEFIGLDEDIEGAIIRFQDRLSFPALTDLKLTEGQEVVWDLYPSPLKDLYYGEPLEILGRMVNQNISQRLVFQGFRGDEKVELTVDLPPTIQSEPGIVRLWARAHLDDLVEQEAIQTKGINRTAIINLALTHRLVTPYTAFVAIDDQAGLEGAKPRQIMISQPLPPGLTLEGFFGIRPARVERYMAQPAQVPDAYLESKAKLNYPAFNRIYKEREESAQVFYTPANQIPKPTEKDLTLHELARTQKINGTWNNDVETTAAALLAFVRSGHTTQDGDYRSQINKAVNWLIDHAGSGFAAFLRALALHELAEATQQKSHLQAAHEAIQGLSPATDDLQRTALAVLKGKPPTHPKPTDLSFIDDLSWKVFVPGASLSEKEKSFFKSGTELEKALAAAVS